MFNDETKIIAAKFVFLWILEIMISVALVLVLMENSATKDFWRRVGWVVIW